MPPILLGSIFLIASTGMFSSSIIDRTYTRSSKDALHIASLVLLIVSILIFMVKSA